MSGSAVELCNQALRLLGEQRINALDEESEVARTCDILYRDTIRGLLVGYPWRFTMRKAQLSRRETPPLTGWTYAHFLPPDLLELRALYASPVARVPPLRDFDRADNLVLSQVPALWADYQIETDPIGWPPAFALLARYALAAEFANPIAGSMSAADYWDRKAYGGPMEGRIGGQMGLARRLDAQQQPATPLTDFPLIAARMGSR